MNAIGSIVLIAYFTWFIGLLVCMGLAVMLMVRRGAAGLPRAMLLTFGGLLTVAFISALIGVMENVYTVTSTGFLISIAIGIAGFACIVFACATGRGLRGAPRPGACPACGYDLRGGGINQPCPECGAAIEDAS
jgi:hypothetical protein